MKISLLLLALFAFFFTNAQKVSVYFENNSATVSNSALQSLKRFAETYDTCRHRLRIEGFSDGVGKEESNQKLSLLRAEAVRLVLVNFALLQAAAAEGYGEKEATAANDPGPNPLYRRVDVMAEPKLCEEQPQGDVANLYQLLQDKGQEFCINPDRDTALVGRNGTVVYYKPGTFQNTASCSCLKLVLHEFYKKSDLILNNLTTTSDGRILESGGMMKLEGFCGKDTLRYARDKFLTVMMPTDTVLPGMKLLSANRTDVSEILNWHLDEDSPQLDDADWKAMMMRCAFLRGRPGKCPFFFCRIRNFFRGGGLNKKQKALEKLYDSLSTESALLKKYAMDEKRLGTALLQSKEANKDVLKYYVYKNANWDYHNIDRYMKGDAFVDYTVNEASGPDKDVKLVYLKSKTVLPSFQKSGVYQFKNVFAKEGVYIIGLRHASGQAYLSLSKENTSSGQSRLDFKPVSIEELRTVLQRIN